MSWITKTDAMENRNNYFLRNPVEFRIQKLIDLMMEMSKEYKDMNGVSIAYKICADQLQNTLTEMKRDDNQQILKLEKAKYILNKK